MNSKEQKEEKLKFLEAEINRVLAELAEEDRIIDQDFNYEDIAQHEEDVKMADQDASSENEIEGLQTLVEDEVVAFLGENPSSQNTGEIKMRVDIADRINFWIKSGLKNKEEKEISLSAVPRKGQVNLEAPSLNEEIAVDLHPRSLSRDNHFKDYQEITGAALAADSSVLSMILDDSEVPLDRDLILTYLSTSVKLLSILFYTLNQARKTFILGRYGEKIQKILKKVEPTSCLFGDNLKNIIESSKTMEKVTKDLKATNPRPPFQQNPNSLNWKSSTARGGGRGSYRGFQSRPNTSRVSNSFNRFRPYPARRYYTQTQPQQARR